MEQFIAKTGGGPMNVEERLKKILATARENAKNANPDKIRQWEIDEQERALLRYRSEKRKCAIGNGIPSDLFRFP